MTDASLSFSSDSADLGTDQDRDLITEHGERRVTARLRRQWRVIRRRGERERRGRQSGRLHADLHGGFPSSAGLGCSSRAEAVSVDMGGTDSSDS